MQEEDEEVFTGGGEWFLLVVVEEPYPQPWLLLLLLVFAGEDGGVPKRGEPMQPLPKLMHQLKNGTSGTGNAEACKKRRVTAKRALSRRILETLGLLVDGMLRLVTRIKIGNSLGMGKSAYNTSLS